MTGPGDNTPAPVATVDVTAAARRVRELEAAAARAMAELNRAVSDLDRLAARWGAERGLGRAGRPDAPAVTANPPIDPSDPVAGVVPRDPRQPDWSTSADLLSAVADAFAARAPDGEQVEAERNVHRRPLPPGVIRRAT